MSIVALLCTLIKFVKIAFVFSCSDMHEATGGIHAISKWQLARKIRTYPVYVYLKFLTRKKERPSQTWDSIMAWSGGADHDNETTGAYIPSQGGFSVKVSCQELPSCVRMPFIRHHKEEPLNHSRTDATTLEHLITDTTLHSLAASIYHEIWWVNSE